MKPTFLEWLDECYRIAMESEWVIDEAWPKWRYLYNEGFSPTDAVGELFKELNNE